MSEMTVITAVDRIPTENYDVSQISSLTRGAVGSTVNVTVLRGGATLQFTVSRAPIDRHGPVPMQFSTNDDKVYLTPSADLKTGTHCLSAGSFMLSPEMIPRWCFVVGP